MTKHASIKLKSPLREKTHFIKIQFIFIICLFQLYCSDECYTILIQENISPETPPFVITREILLSDFQTDSGNDETDMTLLYKTDAGETLQGIVHDQRGMFYSEKTGTSSDCTVIPLAGLINKSQTGEYGSTIINEAGSRFSEINSQLPKNCAETGWCQTMFGFSFFIHKPGTLGQNIGEHRTADLTKTKGIKFSIKGNLSGANLYLVMVSTNIKDWSHWQYKLPELAGDSWQNEDITWDDFSHPGWGYGMAINSVSENLGCIEGFKFVLKNESGDNKISSDLSIDDIWITAN